MISISTLNESVWLSFSAAWSLFFLSSSDSLNCSFDETKTTLFELDYLTNKSLHFDVLAISFQSNCFPVSVDHFNMRSETLTISLISFFDILQLKRSIILLRAEESNIRKNKNFYSPMIFFHLIFRLLYNFSVKKKNSLHKENNVHLLNNITTEICKYSYSFISGSFNLVRHLHIRILFSCYSKGEIASIFSRTSPMFSIVDVFCFQYFSKHVLLSISGVYYTFWRSLRNDLLYKLYPTGTCLHYPTECFFVL